MENKLEILVQKAQGGLRDLKISRKGAWYNKTFDLRNYINHLQISNVFYMLAYNELGAFFTVIRPLAVGRTGDYDAVWIFMDKDITVPASDITNLIAYAQQDLLSGGENYDNLDAFVQKAYPANNFLDIETVQKSGKQAFRVFGQGTPYPYLADIINRDLNQNYYKHYDAVFFFDLATASAMNPSIRSQLADLSNMPFEPTGILYPPTEGANPNRIEVYWNRQPFRVPIRVRQNHALQFLLHRPGFKDVTTNLSVTVPQQNFSFPNNLPWERIVKFDDFRVSCKGKTLSGFVLKVNGQVLRSGASLCIPASQCANAVITVTKQGLQDYRGTCNLLTLEKHKIFMSEIDRPKKKILSSTAIKVIGLLLWSAVMVFLGYFLSQNSEMENGDGRISTDSGSVETMPREGDTVSRSDGRYIVTYKKVKESPKTSSENTSGRNSDKDVNAKGSANGNTSHNNAKDNESKPLKEGEEKKQTSSSSPTPQSHPESATSSSAE